MNNSRQLVFRILLILLPFFLMAALELTLRMFNLFPREPLFLDRRQDGRELIQLNPNVALRYFNPGKVVVPNLFPETFVRTKSPGTFRIFCLGGSTTAGFPFEFQVPFPGQLRIMLERQYPDRRFEVINLGLSAVNSFTVLDFIPEVLEKEPDLILLYMGHNEFYGAYGSASAVSIGQNGALIRFYLKLQKLRTIQMLRTLLAAITPASPNPENATLMEQVIADKKVLLGTRKYYKTLDNFRSNLTIILQRCRSAGVPVIAGTLVSNLKDQPPLGDASLGETDSSLKSELDLLSSRCDRLLQEQHYAEAMALTREMIGKDSLSAALHYRAGKIALALQDSVEASHCFVAAKERDVIRFRASEAVNRIIQETVLQMAAHLADIPGQFSAQSPFGIPGRELICDHLHPNPVGYHLMARIFAAEIEKAHLIGEPVEELPASMDPLSVTDLDWDIGMLRIYKLLHHWPFANRPVDYRHYKPWGEKDAAQVAYDYLFTHHNWVQAHYAMAGIYADRGRQELARREYEAVLSWYPEQPEPFLKIARSYETEERWADAERAFTAAAQVALKKGMIYHQLAHVQWKQKKMAAAIQTIQHAIVAPDLNPGQRMEAKYDLAGWFIAVNRPEYAEQVVRDILQERPDFQPALEMKQRYFSRSR